MAANTADRQDMFSPVTVDRVSQVIVDQIKVLIRDGRLQPGDRLPSERELCQRFGVSRVTVREALRVLEASGLLAIRVGAHGGAFLTTPSAERLGEGLADLISLAPLTATNVTEARIVVELGVLPLAVERATEEDIDALFAMVEDGERAVESGTYNVEMSAAFHIRVAECTHNPAIEMLMQSFHGPMRMSIEESHAAAPMGPRGVEEHRELAEAIKQRDVAAAREVMTTHLDRTAQRVRTQTD
ncbi:FadR/GntR family transcriptional regulator [Nocardioides sp. BP30]|uniref:FadR/GntR family transcriptional regulator n=1 Tax=Nocardioides sp. BP30 TaxID=3036374 RepID=UPI00246960A2|nr:FadR/GntR family transcriptional regulator [Nocardioides sp. BP30]WGL52474.1 FadR/GntR family transcriptional regulator [Nocardioides sp. BP30]